MEYSSIFVCLMGMGTVFFGLICLIALTYLMSAVVGRGKKAAPAPVPAAPQTAGEVTPELVAAVSAALAEELGTDITGIRIVSVARQFFCETRTEFLRKNSPVLRSKSETRSLASTAPKMEGAAHVKGRVLAWGGAAFAAPPLAFCPWGSSYPSVASPASSAASWAATGSVYSDQP